MKKFTLLAILILGVSAVNAQLYKSHDWEEIPQYFDLSAEDQALSSVAIKEKYLIQYYNPVVGKTIRLFETKHSIIRVNTDNGIERHNRVYIPTYNVRNVIEIKARVLEKDGSLKVLDNRNIKELENVEDYGNFKIFAIEGLTKGSQLEVIYTLELNPSGLGSVVVQKNYKINEAEVIVRKPKVLNMQIKAYNKFPKLTLEEVEGNKDAYTGIMKNVPAMIDEKSAAPEANRAKIAYQVSAGYISNERSWKGLASNIRENYMSWKPEKQKNLVEDYTKYKSKTNVSSVSDRVNVICKYITENYTIVRMQNEELNYLKNVLKKKKGTELGIIKLYCTLLNLEEIEYSTVLTSDRFRHTFDSEFYSSANLAEVLLYINSEDMYVNPAHVNARLLPAPASVISNEGVFIDKNTYSFKTITVPSADNTITILDYIINIDLEDLVADVAVHQELSGYRGDMTRGIYEYFSKRDMEEFKNYILVNGIDDASIDEFNSKNEDYSLSTSNVPFKIDATYKAESLLEIAGDAVILNYGMIIGTQIEHYQEAERVNPVIQNFLNKYKYDIKIKIPDGYTPQDLDDIKINQVIKDSEGVVCKFVSDYTVNDDTITITVEETYERISLSLNDYEKYKSVVNAAYDFSKKSILFQKK